MRKWLYIVLLTVVSLSWVTPVTADEPAEESVEVDHVSLAARLVRDGHYDRARSVLSDVDPNAEDLNHADFYTVRGLLALNDARWDEAIVDLEKAIRHGKVDDIVFVYLAQAQWGLQDYEATLRMIRNADEEGEKLASIQLMRAQSLWKLDRLHEAWSVLNRATKRFPEEPQFRRLSFFLLVDLGLYQEALRVAENYLEDSAVDATVEDYLAFGEAMIRNRALERATHLLEKAALLYGDRRVTMQLAHVWSERGKPLVAGELLQRASLEQPALVADAAEMFRKAGALERALYMNAQVEDQKKKFRQRVAILTDRQDFEAVAAMEDRLERLGLLQDQSVLYAVAYARFQVQDYEETERLLKRITDPELFEAATQLRQAMAYCAENPC
jgi:tetratricopeptide (TPR) repeat protein